MLAVDEVVDHVHRAGPVEGVQRDQVLQPIGSIADQNVLHAVRFKLEDARRLSVAEHLVSRLVVERQVLDNHRFASMLLDQRQRVRNDGERRQTQEVHLQQAELFQAHHVVLRDDFVFVRSVKRDKLLQGPGRNHDARRMNRSIARHTLQAQCNVEQLLYLRILLRQRSDVRLQLHRVFELDIQRLRRNEFAQLFDFAETNVHHPTDVFDRRPRPQRPKRDDLSNLLPPVFFSNVLDHVAAPARAEVDIDIRHRDALWIEKALKQQVVLQRIDIGDVHRVGNQRPRRRSTPRPHGNARFLRMTDEVPDD